MKRDPKTGKLPPKKRNDRALMLARERRVCKIKGHVPKNRYEYPCACAVCGKELWFTPARRPYGLG